tara:strand:- start:654 stop:812 length:159 start_codon:yes stop_codon:yes gene_type:complete
LLYHLLVIYFQLLDHILGHAHLELLAYQSWLLAAVAVAALRIGLAVRVLAAV